MSVAVAGHRLSVQTGPEPTFSPPMRAHRRNFETATPLRSGAGLGSSVQEAQEALVAR
jgi:hypothetical protein